MHRAVNWIVMKEGSIYYTGKIDTPDNVEGICLIQMSAAKGIRTFGDRSITVVLSEFSQLDEKGVVEPLRPGNISSQQERCTSYGLFSKRKAMQLPG